MPSLSSLLSSALELVLFPILLMLTVGKTLAGYVDRGFTPLYPKWTLSFEVSRAVKHFATDRYGESLGREPFAGRTRRLTEITGSLESWFSCRRHHTVMRPEVANGLEHIWITANTQSQTEKQLAAASRERFVVVYYHGGGYAVYSPRYFVDYCNTLRAAILRELAARGASSVDIDIFIANYRKTSLHKFPVPAQDAQLMYEYVVTQHGISPRNILVAGDSAGGGLALATLLGLRDAGKQHLMPLAAMAACPYVDLTAEPVGFVPPPHCGLSQPLMRGFREAALVDLSDDTEARRHSAVHADLRGLPPVFVQAASLDYIYQNALDLIAKARADGVANWETDLHDGVPHVFMTTSPSVLPYAAVGLQRLAAFAAKQIEASRKQQQ